MKPRVLVVDDSLTVRMDLGEAFETAGFECVLCSNVAEARAALLEGGLSIAILDVLLPDGDGIEFLKEIKENAATASLPVMLLSSESEVRDRIRGLKTGAEEYVGKPYEQSYVLARARELIRRQEPEATEPRPTTVLIIDDSPTFREELRSALESSGYSVISASSGEEGLRKAVDEFPSAIVVDGQLPGIDGRTVIRRIRGDAALRRTPCILLTASEEVSGEVQALDAGADAYVRKEEDSSVILVRLLATLRAACAPSAIRPTSSLLAPKKVLAVDDSLTYLEEIATQLRLEGYDVAPAHSGEEALELLSVEPVDCILLDLMMPGLSGQETCRRIKDSPVWRDIPLIMHTALDGQDAMIESINAGADDYVSKSSDPEVLRARVRAQLRRKQFEDENRSIREQLLQKEMEIAAAQAARQLAEARARFASELERKNRELEAFSYSVSHDLRAPLRAVNTFVQSLLEDNSQQLDPSSQDLVQRIRASAHRMGEIIDDLMMLARVSRAELKRDLVDLSALVNLVIEELRKQDPERQITIDVEEALEAHADGRLVRVVLENLLGNAFKFTTKTPAPHIQFGAQTRESERVFFVCDNGAGFDMEYAKKLFRPFERLHAESEFTGTGIGLAIVHRIIDHHGGRIWAEAALNLGATFYFTLPYLE